MQCPSCGFIGKDQDFVKTVRLMDYCKRIQSQKKLKARQAQLTEERKSPYREWGMKPPTPPRQPKNESRATTTNRVDL